MNLTPSFFFFLSEGKVIGYNLITQKYYEIDEDSFEKLKYLSKYSEDKNENDGYSQLRSLGFEKDSLSLMWDGDVPSHIIHQSSRIYAANTPQLSKDNFVEQYTQWSSRMEQVPEKDRVSGSVTQLPEPSLDSFKNSALDFCFKNRKTSREFYNEPVELNEISNILYACFGQIHGQEREDLACIGLRSSGFRRSSPSSTGLASCDAIVWIHNVCSLDAGIYSYNEYNHTLTKHPKNMSENELIYAMLDQFWVQNLPCGIFIVNDMRRTWAKDQRSRGYIASHLESGHLSQNILLCSTALKLNTWISGSFRDDFLNERLDLPDYRFVSLFIGIGHGSNRPLSQEYIDLLTDISNPASID